MENQELPPLQPPSYATQSSAAAAAGGGGLQQQQQQEMSVQVQVQVVQQQQQEQQEQQQLQMFWRYQRQEMMSTALAASEFKNHQLPLARIKRIMKADEDVRMISAEAPVLFAKACELFILELTIRSWLHAEENKRRTLQRNDVAAAVARTDLFDFLLDIVPRPPGPDVDPPPLPPPPPPPPPKDAIVPPIAGLMAPAPGLPYYYPPPPPPPIGLQGVLLGQPAVPGIDPTVYAHMQAAGAQGWPPVWPRGTVEDGGYGANTTTTTTITGTAAAAAQPRGS